MADTAGFAQKRAGAHRSRPRIVPAIPHRLSKRQPPARPLTPEESNKGTVTQQKPATEPEPEPQVVEKQAPEPPQEQQEQQEQQAAAIETPPTPDSRVDDAEANTPVLPPVHPSSQRDEVAPANAQDVHVHVNGKPHVNGQVNGHAPSAPPPTASDRPAEPKPAVNGVHRKIPAQLPPPFYPSYKTDTQTPPADGSDAAPTPSHRHQLSAGALVFRSANGSPAMPATPQEHELATHAQQSMPRPPPGFGPQQFAPFFPGHAQHLSEAGAPWHLPPHAVAPPDAAAFENGVDYPSAQFSAAPTVYPSPYSAHFSPGDAPFVANGTATSHSQSPSKAHFVETVPTSDHGEEQHAMAYQNGAGPTERLEESPFELAAYLSTQYGNPEFADFTLQVRSPEGILLSVPVHGIVVVRSPVIAEALRRSPAPSHRGRDARRLVDVLALDPLTTRESLDEAIKVLYGAPLLSAQTFLYGLAPYMYDGGQASSSNDARRRMQQVLSYIAAARTLQMPSMQARGIEIARLLLRWDTIDQVIRYALQADPGPRPRPEGPDTDDPFIAALTGYAVEFVAYTFPADFKLCTIAPEFKDVPRLPALVESQPQPTTHKSRLSKIRFGEAQPEDGPPPSHLTSVLSTILLSLPPSFIERLFNHRATANHIGWTGAANVLRDIINERENRRRKAYGQLKQTPDGAIPNVLLHNVYTEERVEQVEPSPQHPCGHRLATKRVAGEP